MLASCSNKYYGYDKAAWDQMSPDKKARIKKNIEELAKENQVIRAEMAEARELMNRAGKY